jgi:hypothetical protein
MAPDPDAGTALAFVISAINAWVLLVEVLR